MFRRGSSLPTRDSSKSGDNPRSHCSISYKGYSSWQAASARPSETRHFQSFGRALSAAKKPSSAFSGRSILHGNYSHRNQSYSPKPFEPHRHFLTKNLENENCLDAVNRDELVLNMTNLTHMYQQQSPAEKAQYQYDSPSGITTITNTTSGNDYEEMPSRQSLSPNMQNSVHLNEEEDQQNHLPTASTANSSLFNTCYQKTSNTTYDVGVSGCLSNKNFQSTKLATQNVHSNAKKTSSRPLNPYAKEWKPAAMRTDGVVSGKINFFERCDTSHRDSSIKCTTCTDFSNDQQIIRRDVQFQPNNSSPDNYDHPAISESNAYHKLEYFTSPFFFNFNDPKPTVLKTFDMSKGNQKTSNPVHPHSSHFQQRPSSLSSLEQDSSKTSDIPIAQKLNETQQKLKNYFGFGSVDKRLFQWSLQNSNSDELLQKFEQHEREQNNPPKKVLMPRMSHNKMQKSESFEKRVYPNKSQPPLLDQLPTSLWGQPFQFQQRESRTLINDFSYSEPSKVWTGASKGMDYYQKFGKEILEALNHVNESKSRTLGYSSTCHSKESAQSYYGLTNAASINHIANVNISASVKENPTKLHDTEHNGPSTECLPKVRENVAFFENFAKRNSCNATPDVSQSNWGPVRKASSNFLVKKFRQIFETENKSVASEESLPHNNKFKELILQFDKRLKQKESHVSTTLKPSSKISNYSATYSCKTTNKAITIESSIKLSDSNFNGSPKRKDRKPHNRIMRSYRRHRFRDETQDLDIQSHTDVKASDNQRLGKGFYAGEVAKKRRFSQSSSRVSPRGVDATFSPPSDRIIACRSSFEQTLVAKDVKKTKLTEKLIKNGGFSYIFPNAESVNNHTEVNDDIAREKNLKIKMTEERSIELDQSRKSDYVAEVDTSQPELSDKQTEKKSEINEQNSNSSESSSSLFGSASTCTVITMIAANELKNPDGQKHQPTQDKKSDSQPSYFRIPKLLKSTQSDELSNNILTIYDSHNQRELTDMKKELGPTQCSKGFLNCLHDFEIGIGMGCRPRMTLFHEKKNIQNVLRINRRIPKRRPSTERHLLDKRHIFLLRFQYPFLSKYAYDLNIFYFAPEIFNWPAEDLICKQLLKASLIAFSCRVNVMKKLNDVYNTFRVELFHVMKGARRSQRFSFIDNYILSSLKNAFRLRKIQYRKKLMKQQACEMPKKLHLKYCSSKSSMDISWTYNGRLQLAQFVLKKISDEIDVLGVELSSPIPHISDSSLLAMPLLDIMAKYNLLAFMKLVVCDILLHVVDLCKRQRLILVDTVLTEAGDGDAGLLGESEA